MNQHTKERCIKLAQDLMPTHRTGRAFHMTFILHRSKLLVWATNNYNHQHLSYKWGNYVPTRTYDTGNYIAGRHSEGESLKKFVNKFRHSDFSGLTLFNVRIGFDGKPMIAAPCQNCDRLFIQPNNFKEGKSANNWGGAFSSLPDSVSYNDVEQAIEEYEKI